MPHRQLHYGYPAFLPGKTASLELALITTACFLYFLVRGVTEGSAAPAYRNAERVLELESRLGIAWEVAWQSSIVGSHALITLVNWIYIWGHWPFIAVVAIWLLLKCPAEYRLLRNAFLFSGGIGICLFISFPVAPPRLMDIGMVDTVTAHSNSYRVLQPTALVNQYAAVPSLHFGWNLLIGITLFRFGKRRIVRLIGILSPAAMFFATVLTANHYIFDPIAGGIVALAGLGLAILLRRAATRCRRAPGRPPPPTGGAKAQPASAFRPPAG